MIALNFRLGEELKTVPLILLHEYKLILTKFDAKPEAAQIIIGTPLAKF